MLENVNKVVISFLFKGDLPAQNAPVIEEARNEVQESRKLDS